MFGGKIGVTELLFLLGLVAILLPIVALIAWPWYKIFGKAGHSPLLCLVMFVPVVNLIVLFWFAFSTWPIETELARLRQENPSQPGAASEGAHGPPTGPSS